MIKTKVSDDPNASDKQIQFVIYIHDAFAAEFKLVVIPGVRKHANIYFNNCAHASAAVTQAEISMVYITIIIIKKKKRKTGTKKEPRE